MDIRNNCIGRRLKEARIASGLTQKKLGILAGIDELTASARMNQYETGRHTPNLLTLNHIAKALGYPTAFFLSEDNLIAKINFLAGKLLEADKLIVLGTAEKLFSNYITFKNISAIK